MLPRNQEAPACPCMTPGQSCFHQTTGTAPGGPLGRLDCSPSETHITSSGQVSPRFRPRADQMLSQEPRGPYIAQMGKVSSLTSCIGKSRTPVNTTTCHEGSQAL